MTPVDTSRRTALRLFGIAGGAILVAGCGGPEEDAPEQEEGTGNGQEVDEEGAEDENESEDDEELTTRT